jgi:hypothetical protein
MKRARANASWKARLPSRITSTPAGGLQIPSRTTHKCSSGAFLRTSSSWIARGLSEYCRPPKLEYTTASRSGSVR